MARRMSVTSIEEISDPEISRSEVDESIGSTDDSVSQCEETAVDLTATKRQRRPPAKFRDSSFVPGTEAQLEAKMRNSKLLALVVV